MTRAAERGDVIAYLDRRIGNHAKVASTETGSEERAAWLRRELEIVRDHLAAGLHEHEAEIAQAGAQVEREQ
jgi:hypothetical protein